MQNPNLDKIFEPLLIRVQTGEIKTTHQLRLVLEELGEQYEVQPLHLLVTFREWLQSQGIDLQTEHGIVVLGRNE